VYKNAYQPPLNADEKPSVVESGTPNWKWIEQNKVWAVIDSKGREYPCVEYDYNPEGWDEDEF